MSDTIAKLFRDSSELKAKIAADQALLGQIERGAYQLINTIRDGGTIYSCGNGGSACDAMHFTEELIARFKAERPGIKAMHMMDPSTMTCWSNDYQFESVFERYVKTFCGPKDVLVGFSTSGNSPNILRAMAASKATKTFSIGLGGKDGGKMKESCDLAIVVPSTATERIQEAHITIVHIWCELIERALCGA